MGNKQYSGEGRTSPLKDKRYVIYAGIILFLIVGGMIHHHIYRSNPDLIVWHKISKIGLHSPLDITWAGPHTSKKIIIKGVDSIVYYMDSLFNENHTDNPFRILSHSPKGTTVQLKDDQHSLLRYLLDEIENQSLPNNPLKLGAGEWVYRYKLTEDTSAPQLTKKIQDSLSQLLNTNYYQLESNNLKVNADSLHLTLGSVSKGFGIKKIAEFMRSSGVTRYLINAGGDLQFAGLNSRDTSWSIGIRHPRGQQDELLGVVFAPQDNYYGMATSGDYELFKIENGRRIHHLIDGNTGIPISDKQSLSVMAVDGLAADYYATFLFLLPVTSVLELADKNSAFEVMVVDSLGNTHFSSGMKSMYKDLKEVLK